MKPADICEEIGVDKSVVSRWYSGASPTKSYQAKLAALFGCSEESLFRHPDDDWMTRFLSNRRRDEVERIKKALDIMFPRAS